ncbi:MAG: hypothetical protein IKX39_01300 [Muribaculaceae bacterium]|nr:hypothetical protein [Muribaculaceae bacterium]
MKKFLLFAATAAMMAMSASAIIDNQLYEPVNDINIANVWILDRVHAGDAFTGLEACNTKARTAVMVDDIIYVARSEAKSIINGSDTLVSSLIYRFKVEDGTELEPLEVSLNGNPLGTLLCINCIGVDNFGHIWITPYTSELTNDQPFYSLNTDTGELTQLTTFTKDSDSPQRIDYCDVLGDITLEEAGCTVMAAAANSSLLYRWHAEQGDTWENWEGGFDGDTYLDIIDYYPENQTAWGTAPTVKMLYDPNDPDNYDGELFYVDGFSVPPALYSLEGTIVDSFEGVDPELIPESGTNGITEFELEGRHFVVYSKAQYSGDGHGCQANICEMGEGLTFEGMQKYWQIPADSLGKVSDGGIRAHCFSVKYGEEGGFPCVTLFTFKCYNGMAVYKIGRGVTPNIPEPPTPSVPGDSNGDGLVDISDVNAVINMMLGKAEMVAACDMNNDGKIDISDVNAVINAMLGK